jgi:alginate O-acetyltransferase complex protein AlgI
VIFASGVFLYGFLPLFLGLYFLSPRSVRSYVIAVASYVFYGWWRPDFVLLMLLSTGVDYTAGARIARGRAVGRRGRPWLGLSVVANLGLLGYFKYANFGIDTLQAILGRFGFDGAGWPEVVLPVGISFYTFQTMSYTIDVYRGASEPVRSFRDFLCYVAMFPQLVAGPIVRYHTIADQLHERVHTLGKFYQGVLSFQSGLAKKVLLADVLGEIADRAFALGDPSPAAAWTGIVAYAFQIYFDFSGYSDMAIGLGLMMGFRLPINFDRPYRAVSITDFWRRWHISLSSFLRDYLYVPLGGNRKGPVRTYANLAVTMLLGGLWHGAAWNFVIWGGYQGFWLVVERLAGKRSLYARTPKPVRIALTFVLVLVGWVFFRARTLEAAGAYLAAMFGLVGGAPGGLAPLEIRPIHWIAGAAAGVVVWGAPTTQRLASRPRWGWAIALQALFLVTILQMHYQDHVPFLYYQF